jgi:hypothetical protein
MTNETFALISLGHRACVRQLGSKRNLLCALARQMQLHLLLVWAFFNCLRASLQVAEPYDSESVFFQLNFVASVRRLVDQIHAGRFLFHSVCVALSRTILSSGNAANALGEVMQINTPSMTVATTFLMSGNSINHL